MELGGLVMWEKDKGYPSKKPSTRKPPRKHLARGRSREQQSGRGKGSIRMKFPFEKRSRSGGFLRTKRNGKSSSTRKIPHNNGKPYEGLLREKPQSTIRRQKLGIHLISNLTGSQEIQEYQGKI
ncbi:hypothetical protein Salat_2888500 [Sesamum alatum]|uniref:Uncharacterized protein n=1 Tax=Sesamum alatum TaxID=300844 RepID=A0AAE2C8B0_9LAMI|nr:hypothetical protein Salat_2888500 [Sesamum alatum]